MLNLKSRIAVLALVAAACNTTTETSQRSQQGVAAGASSNAQQQKAVTAPTSQVATTTPSATASVAPAGVLPANPVVQPIIPVANQVAAPAPVAAANFNASVPVFHIKAGTGKGPWNDASTPMLMTKGGDFQLVNDDTEQHWLHTNGRPFPHPDGPLAPGETGTYKVSSDFTGALHDHLTNAAVYLQTQ